MTPERRGTATRRRSDWVKVITAIVSAGAASAAATIYAQANIPAAAPEVRVTPVEAPSVTREEFAELRERVRQVDERTVRMETLLLNESRRP